jgi:hypothetical protein
MQTRSPGRVAGPGSIVQNVNPDTQQKRLLSMHTTTATCHICTIDLPPVHICRYGRGAVSGCIGVKKGLLGSPFDSYRVLDSLEFSKLPVGGQSAPPRFEGGEVVEVNHDVTRRRGRPKDLNEAIARHAVAVPEVQRHINEVLACGRSLTADNAEPSVHPVHELPLVLAPRLLVESTPHQPHRPSLTGAVRRP